MKIYLVTIMLFLSGYIFCQSTQLSEHAQVSLLTCDSGNELYSIFGHSAFRIKDSTKRIDRIYNYGTFSFQTPNFYLKFMQGKLNYQLTVTSFQNFMYEYIHSKRSVYEQVLDLTPYQKQKIFNFVENNSLPENKYYLYDFFYDNCATRLRDVVSLNLGDSVVFDKNALKYKYSFRELLYSYLENDSWTHLGINIVLGSPTDKVVTSNEAMFLPEYLKAAFGFAKIQHKYTTIPLIKKENCLFSGSSRELKKVNFFIL